jgi:hypothetical protein
LRNSPAASAAGGRLTARKDEVLAPKDHLMTAPQLSPAPASKLGACRPRWTTFAMISLALLVLPLAAGCSKEASSQKQEPNATASASDPTVARVNGVEIRESDLAMAEQDIGQNLQNAPPEAQREQLIAYVTDIILVSQAANGKKLSDDPDFQHHLAFIRNKMLMGLQLREEAKGAVTDEAEHKLYEEAVKPMGAEEEVHARHILVETEDEAKAIVEQIKGGADFAALAKEKSKDQSGEDAVRLAHHQARGQADAAGAGAGRHQGADRHLSGAPRAVRIRRQAAPDRQDRAPRPSCTAPRYAAVHDGSRRPGAEVVPVLGPGCGAAQLLRSGAPLVRDRFKR